MEEATEACEGNGSQDGDQWRQIGVDGFEFAAGCFGSRGFGMVEILKKMAWFFFTKQNKRVLNWTEKMQKEEVEKKGVTKFAFCSVVWREMGEGWCMFGGESKKKGIRGWWGKKKGKEKKERGWCTWVVGEKRKNNNNNNN